MAEKEDKVVLEREYIVPLRRKFLRTPKYKRVPKAVKALKQFIVRHMKIYDKDFNKIKIDKFLNEELWFRGIRKPLGKVKVKARKFESGIVKVELVELPSALKFKKEKEEKVGKEIEKKREEKKVEEKKEEVKEDEQLLEKVGKTEIKEEEKKEEVEKEKATMEAGLKEAKEKAKEMKHEVMEKKVKKPEVRKALQK